MLPHAPVTVEGMQIVDPMSYRISVGDKCRDICDYQKSRFTERVATYAGMGYSTVKN
jgi:hypothetical protein